MNILLADETVDSAGQFLAGAWGALAGRPSCRPESLLGVGGILFSCRPDARVAGVIDVDVNDVWAAADGTILDVFLA